MSRDAMQVDFDEGQASLRLRDVSVMDAHDLYNNLTNGKGYAPLGVAPVAPVPATVSFDIEWSGVLDSAEVVNMNQSFRGLFKKTGATIDWSAQSAGFSFQSEPRNPAWNLYAVIAHEKNGAFFNVNPDD